MADRFDIIVNLQGDAPLTPAWFVEDLVQGLRENPDAQVATPVLRTEGRGLNGLLQDRREGRVAGQQRCLVLITMRSISRKK